MAVSTSSRRRIAGLTVFLVGFFWFGCGQDADDLTAPGDRIAQIQEILKPAIHVQARHTDRLMAVPGVVGTAVGLRPDGQPAIKIFTREAGISQLPESLEGVPVTVEVTGMIVALSAVSDPTARFPRPVPIGVSTGHPDITAGTIGARVTDGTNVYALSNNHVYANSNDAQLGDPVIQPGSFDGGSSPDDDIGTLHDFEPIDFSGGDNTIDAAIALSSTDLLGNATPSDGYGTPGSATVTASVGQAVQKFGRTTGLTKGEVSEVNVTVDVCYECAGPFCFNCKKLARFVDQIAVTPGDFSGGGDSGSLIVTDDANVNPVGLLFAGSDTRTFCNPIDAVLGRFNVTIDDGSGGGDGGDTNSPPTSSFTSSCTDLTCDFTDQSTDSDGSVVAWDWDFGDGNTSSVQNPSHTYAAGGTYTVALTVTDDDNATDTSSEDVTVNEPSAGVSVTGIDPNSMQAGTSVDVTITGSGFVDGADVTFENGSGPAPSATSVVVSDTNNITATVTVKSGGPPRNRVFDVRVTNPDASTDVLVDGFTVTP